MINNVLNKAKNIIFKSKTGLDSNNVNDAIDEVNGRIKKLSVAKNETLTVNVKEGCLLVWSQNTNCGGVVVIDTVLGYAHKVVNKNDDAGNFKVSFSNGNVTITNNLGGSVQCYLQVN